MTFTLNITPVSCDSALMKYDEKFVGFWCSRVRSFRVIYLTYENFWPVSQLLVLIRRNGKNFKDGASINRIFVSETSLYTRGFLFHGTVHHSEDQRYTLHPSSHNSNRDTAHPAHGNNMKTRLVALSLSESLCFLIKNRWNHIRLEQKDMFVVGKQCGTVGSSLCIVNGPVGRGGWILPALTSTQAAADLNYQIIGCVAFWESFSISFSGWFALFTPLCQHLVCPRWFGYVSKWTIWSCREDTLMKYV